MREAARVVDGGVLGKRLVAWSAGLVAVLAGAVAAGQGALAAPDLRRPATWSAWASQRSPAQAAVAVLRLTVVVLALYLLVATVIAVVTQVGDTAGDIVALPFVRGIVQGVLGAGIAGAALAATVSHPLAPRAPSTADVALVQPVDRAPAPPPPSGHADRPPGAVPVTRTQTWTVAPGESFWSIAERNANGVDVATYWRTLIDANRDRLADPDNPDLLFPGQVLSLPSGA